MTLVLALRCREAIVLASDGQATTDAAGQPTREPARKLFDIDGAIAWGAAGSVGLQQTLAAALAAGEDLRELPTQALRARIAELVLPIQQRAVRDYVHHPGGVPPELACLFCWCDAGGPRILSIPRSGSDHQFHERYAAAGSGDIFAAFALRSILHLDTPDLGVEQAKMDAYKAVSDAIDVAAAYLGPPIQMYVVDAAGAAAVPAHELEGGLAASVDAWRTRQREALGPLEGAAALPGDSRLGVATAREATQ
jgi:20S proteasome alpha/beta subunit